MDIKELALPIGAALVSGAVTAYLTPKIAKELVKPADAQKYWYAQSAIGTVLGAGLLAAGMMRQENDAIAHSLAVGGAAMIGMAGGLGFATYNALPKKTAAPQIAAGNIGGYNWQVAGHMGAGHMAAGNLDNQADFPGLTPTQRYYAQRGGMPVRSGG